MPLRMKKSGSERLGFMQSKRRARSVCSLRLSWQMMEERRFHLSGFLPVLGVSPEFKDCVLPCVLVVDGMFAEQVFAETAMEGRLDAAVGHLRLHVALHALCLGGVSVVGEGLSEGGDEGVGHGVNSVIGGLMFC